MSTSFATDDAAAAATAAPHAGDLRTAADCKAYLRSLPGGDVALEQAAAVTASLNARHDVLHQEELTYLLQVRQPLASCAICQTTFHVSQQQVMTTNSCHMLPMVDDASWKLSCRRGTRRSARSCVRRWQTMRPVPFSLPE